ncbi:MAG: putative rane protein [Thermoleophilia bacterium]|nr:putative rane protein [Thermoleophilia bacterium]
MTAIAPSGPATHESWKSGVAGAGIGTIVSFQKTLMKRPPLHQAIITVAAAGIGFGAGVGADASAKALERGTGLGEMASRLTMAGVAGAGAVGIGVALKGRSNLLASSARTGLGLAGAGALAGAGLVGEQKLVDQVKDSVPGGALTAHAALLGGTALAGAALALKMPRSSAMSKSADEAYHAMLAGIPKAPDVPPVFDAARAARIDAQRALMTTVSGKRDDSVLPYAKLDAQGVRFLSEITTPQEISRVMGGDAKSPFRIYTGLHHAPSNTNTNTNADKVRGTVHEAGKLKEGSSDRTALDSAVHKIVITSGTGYNPPAATSAAEFLTKGDITTYAFQYGNKPSIVSPHKVPEAAKLVEEVLSQLVPAIRARPGGADKKIVLYAESLGAWATQDALRGAGADAAKKYGVDIVFNAGTPRFSKFRTDLLGFAGHSVDRTKQVAEFDNVLDLKALRAANPKLNTYLFSHYNDPVTRWTPSQLVEAPPYLTNGDNAIGIPRTQKWYPLISGIQGVFDSANGASLPRGVLGSTGHDYRGDIAPVLGGVLDVSTTAKQMSGIIESSNQSELAFLARMEREARDAAIAAAPTSAAADMAAVGATPN